MKAPLIFAAGFIAGAGAAAAYYHTAAHHPDADTAPAVGERITVVERHDTVVIRQPEVMVVHHRDTIVDTLRMSADTARSIAVAIPMEQRCYSGAGYRAWVSGYRPTLDSIALLHTSTTRTTRTIVPATPRKQRWSVGISAGAGVTPGGIEPFVGIGISYALFFF